LKYILTLYWFFFATQLYAQQGQRVSINLNDNWAFTKDAYTPGVLPGKAVQWQPVHLPHTWNADDVMDDAPGYYRGVGWYRKKLLLDKTLQGKEVWLFFEGVNQQTEIFINGKKAGDHTGGYTAFHIPITSLLDWDKENELLVKVDNSYNRNIPPLSADFTFYGGIYRQVSLVPVEPVHFSLNDNGSNAIFISTPTVNNRTAVVMIRGVVSNKKNKAGKIKITTLIYDANGKEITGISSRILLAAGANKNFEQVIKTINQPHLWSPADPYLYKVVTSIVDEETGRTLDEIINPLGFRWFHFDAGNGFFLNGNPVKLVGTSRHQDYKGLGNAVPGNLARKDVALIKEMGGNFLRVAHYPQDPSVLQACDELGIIASVEIPIVNEITESDSFYHNCEQMQVEMIRQNFNHPSVIMWCYMNEVLLKPQFNDNKERQKTYFSNITRLAKRLDSITRKEDPYRYTMIAHHGDYNRYKSVGLIDIPMVVGWNLYSGWYGANLTDFPVFLDQFHKDYPGKPMMVTEYGADADPRIRSNEPVRFDKSVEYATLFHQYYFKEMLKRPFVAAAMIWNLADFNSETRTESMPHINNKGLLEWDRKPKDPYYYYKAMLVKEPFVKILGASLRGGIADSGTVISYQRLQVASNAGEIQLAINGQSQGNKRVENGICEWKIPFKNGINAIEAKAVQNEKTYNDHAEIEFRLQEFQLMDTAIHFNELNVLLGAKRYFTGKDNQVWLPDQEYHKGSWGHIGGKPFILSNNGRLPYGTDKNIKDTDDDPVYQTQQIGIEKYRLDVPAGEYELSLHFSELLGGSVKELPYNLAASDRIEPTGKRIFDVLINDKLFLDHFNIAEQYGSATAVIKTTKVSAKENGGIEIVFKPIEGTPILNAIQVKRIGAAKQDDPGLFK
jgi:beta-galactosidase